MLNFSWLIKLILKTVAKTRGITFRDKADYFELKKNNSLIYVNKNHLVYTRDIINSFDYYFDAVESVQVDKYSLVDYSKPAYHDVKGYNRHPVFFPSFSEPLATTHQYIEFANLSKGSVVFDLGAYAGLTSIIFKDIVGEEGSVIAVDADKFNIKALEKNFSLYKNITGLQIEFLEGAVWSHTNGVSFSSEGNMGSSAVSILGLKRGGTVNLVQSFTLSSIVQSLNLQQVDFIKCDIEGGEAEIFKDTAFFKKFKPRIIIEAHVINNIETTKQFMNDLEQYGYSFKEIDQLGVEPPLIECYPPATIEGE